MSRAAAALLHPATDLVMVSWPSRGCHDQASFFSSPARRIAIAGEAFDIGIAGGSIVGITLVRLGLITRAARGTFALLPLFPLIS